MRCYLTLVFKLTNCRIITGTHSMNAWSQVFVGIEFNCVVTMQGAHHGLSIRSNKEWGE